MKGARPWNAMDPLSSLSSDGDGDSSSSDSEYDDRGKEKQNNKNSSGQSGKGQNSTTRIEGKRSTIDYEALSRHGYYGGPSVLNVPPPRPVESVEQDWSWSAGKRKGDNERRQEEESYKEREETRHAATEGAALSAAEGIAEYKFMKKQKTELRNEQKAISFSQKEKRKRDLGQASRGKSYVEEEKRLLRNQGVYSGFDS